MTLSLSRLRRRLSGRLPLLVVLLVSFLSTVGMGIVFPVLPFMVSGILGDSAPIAVWVGVLEAVYALCALVAAPFLGALSDRVGRKPVLIACLLGTAVGWLVFGLGGALWALLLGRVLDGVTGGDMSVASAYLADITPAEDRPRRFGLVGAVSGVGFLVGPAIGGLLAPISLVAPILLAAAVSLVTAALAAFVMPESLAPERRTTTHVDLAEINPIRTVRAGLRRPVLGPLLIGFGLSCAPLAVLSTNLPVLAMQHLAWEPMQVGLLMSAVGVTDIIVQGALLGRMLTAAGPRGVIIGGLVGQAVASAMLAAVASVLALPSVMVVAALLFATAQGASGAALQGSISASVPDAEQGWLAGGMASIASLIQLVGPIVTGVLYTGVAAWAPYAFVVAALVGAAVLLRTQLADAPAGTAAQVPALG
jgi:DHA1 family tetracycline resistance protein-like MFS transporter